MALIRLERKTMFWLRMAIGMLILFVVLLIFGIWFQNKYRIDKLTDVEVVIIGSGGRYSEEEIRDYVLDEWFEQYYILIDWYYNYREVEPLPYLEKITVNVVDGKVTLNAYEKLPIGCIFEMENYLYFDADGVIVSSKKENVEGLPVITGLEYESVVLYKPFETKQAGMYEVVMNLVHQMEKHAVVAEEIHFGSDEAVKLYVDGHCISLGKRDAYDVQIAMIRGILDKLAKQQQGSDDGESDGSEGGKAVKYDINMENVYDSDDQFYATEREVGQN